MVEILMCQGVHNSNIQRHKLILGPWLLAGIVFSYGFQGDNIKQFTTAQQTNPIDSFKEIADANYAIYSKHTDYVQNLVFDCVQIRKLKNALENVDPVNFCIDQRPLGWYESTFEVEIHQAYFEQSRDFTIMEEKLLELIKRPTTVDEFRQSMEKPVEFISKKFEGCVNVMSPTLTHY